MPKPVRPKLVPFPEGFDPMEPPLTDGQEEVVISLSEFLVKMADVGILDAEELARLNTPLETVILHNRYKTATIKNKKGLAD